MKNFLKGPQMAIIWTILRIWLGVQWLTAGWGKVVGGFDASGYLQGVLANATGEAPTVQAWYATFIEGFAIPNVGLINILIPWGELLVGIGLILGAATIPALIAGAFMNLNFLLAGTLSTNPIFYTVAIVLLFTGAASYHYGVDRFIAPYIKARFHKKVQTKPTDKTVNFPA
ncbi:DoxX family protein [Oceanobacillus alkalisoli]|uniref:DoxX family protein n=1 Tax=Oceanobacillus alkalisoli TaxID=2925113 RepID=UPI001EEF90DC|nr:DoxX family protein [Oceanobacillus alkalisoli]MCF3944265.1 DoxX family protein [Oceanobacillus alkalisoli]MCG5105329.1 DoxX family protein [Oceanobacillus alkalisoli]